MTRLPTELFDCERVNAYLDSYLLGQVPPPERREMRQHIHRCAACFDKVTARDPLQLFAPLAEQTPGDQHWEGFWTAVSEGIREEDARRRAGRRVLLRAAAVLLAVAGLTAALLLRPAPVSPPAMVATGEPGLPGPAVAEAGAVAPLPQTVERVRTEGSREVQIYSMSYNAGPSQGPNNRAPAAELVLIVDQGLEL